MEDLCTNQELLVQNAQKKMINTLLYVVTLQKLVVVLALVPDQALIAMTNVLD